jgi:hypothetical protein
MKSGHQGSLSRHHGKSASSADGGKVRPAKKRRKVGSAPSQLGSIDNEWTARTRGPCARRTYRTLHVLDFSRIEVYEAGASLITLLAYPGENDEQSEAIHASLCHLAVRTTGVLNPDWARSPQRIRPLYALRTPQEVSKDLRTVPRRLRDRMAAGRMAIGFLKEVATGHEPELPAGIERLSVNQMANLVLEDTANIEVENVKTRVWRPSLPVIHLASATQLFLQFLEPERKQLPLETLLLNRPVIEYIVRTAELHEKMIVKSPRLRIDPDKLIKVRLG